MGYEGRFFDALFSCLTSKRQRLERNEMKRARREEHKGLAALAAAGFCIVRITTVERTASDNDVVANVYT